MCVYTMHALNDIMSCTIILLLHMTAVTHCELHACRHAMYTNVENVSSVFEGCMSMHACAKSFINLNDTVHYMSRSKFRIYTIQ